MKSKEFLDILTRVVNSRSGPRFLEVLHELREILEKAGIAEEAEQKLEPGKPIRQRVPEDVVRRAREAPAPLPPPPEAESPKGPDEEAPSAHGPLLEREQEPVAAPAKPEEAGPPEPSPSFIEAGPNRLIRKPEEPPPLPEGPPAKPPRKESLRAIVQTALQEGAKDMAKLKEVVLGKRGQVSHLYQQIYLALRQIKARKSESGVFSLPGEGSPEGSDGASKSAEGKAAGGVPEAEPEEAKGPAGGPAAGLPGSLKQLNIIEEMARSSEDPPA